MFNLCPTVVVVVVVVVAIIGVVVNGDITEDFCDQKLCGKVLHVACNPVRGLQSTCPTGNATQVVTQGALQTLILDLHNRYRSQLATGQLPNYKPAAKMLQMQWDDTLAYVAGYNARSCTFGHDKCRATHAFKLSGQNIAAISGTGGYTADAVYTKMLVDGWWNEYVSCTQDVMAAYRTLAGPQTGHFTAMAQQKSGHVGCAIVRYHGPKWFSGYVVCNYEYTNVIGEEVYEAGAACSKCPSGTTCSKAYPGLCL